MTDWHRSDKATEAYLNINREALASNMPEKRLSSILIHHMADGTKLYEMTGSTFGVPTPSEIEDTKLWGAQLATAYLNDEPRSDGTSGEVQEIVTIDGRVICYHNSKVVFIECDVLIEDLKPGEENIVSHNREVDELCRIADEVLRDEKVSGEET